MVQMDAKPGSIQIVGEPKENKTQIPDPEIEETNGESMARKLELQSVRSSERGKDLETNQYSKILRELDHVKGELSRLELDMASALESKGMAEKEIEASDIKAWMCSGYIEELKKEIEVVNEEQFIVELARMEAGRELEFIEAQRAEEAARFSASVEEARRRIMDRHKEIHRANELQKKLATTTSDVNVLQNEMELIREMEKNFKKNHIMKKEDELQDSTLFCPIEAELEAAKKEFVRSKDVGFQLMAAMDLVREELMQIAEESKRLLKSETKTGSAIQYLNSKLLKSKSKLESARVADERTKAILSNLSAALQQLQTDVEEAKKEEEQVGDETNAIKLETEMINLGIDSTEGRLQAAMEELEAVKASEAIALARLRADTERTMNARALASQHSSSITISKFEYKYLRDRAEGAQEAAEKKLAAAQAWTEALEAREKEISVESEIVRREINDLRVVGEREMDEQRCDEKEAKSLDLQFAVAMAMGVRRENGVPGESRRAKIRRSSVSSGGRRRSYTRSPTFNVKKKRKVVPNLVRFLKGQRVGSLK